LQVGSQRFDNLFSFSLPSTLSKKAQQAKDKGYQDCHKYERPGVGEKSDQDQRRCQ
jgi:hypothetical protein